MLGIRIYDTCSQENSALKAVLETALEANLTQSLSCREGVHLGNLVVINCMRLSVMQLRDYDEQVSCFPFGRTQQPCSC